MSDAPHTSIQCLNCGYDVAGMKPEGVCPECAQPVLASIHAGDLFYSDARFVEHLLTAVNTLLWSTKLVCAGICASMVLLYAGTEHDVVTFWLSVSSALSIIAGVSLWYAGVWRLTAAEIRPAWRESRWSSRRWARQSTRWTVIFFFSSLLAWFIFFIPVVLYVVAALVQLFASIAFLGRLGTRAGDRANGAFTAIAHVLGVVFVLTAWLAHAFVALPLVAALYLAIVRLRKNLQAVQARQQKDAAERVGLAIDQREPAVEAKKPEADAPGLYRPS